MAEKTLWMLQYIFRFIFFFRKQQNKRFPKSKEFSCTCSFFQDELKKLLHLFQDIGVHIVILFAKLIFDWHITTLVGHFVKIKLAAM